MRFAKHLLYFNFFGIILLATSTFAYDLYQRHRIASFIVEAHRNNLMINDLRAISSEAGAIRELFYRIDVEGKSVLTLFDEHRNRNGLLSYVIEKTTYSDNKQISVLAKVRFFFDPLPPIVTGIALWGLISLLATPLLRKKLLGLERSHQMAEQVKLERRFADIAKQVSHDIRSPVSALNIVANAATKLTHDERQLIQSAAKRINDIAGKLLEKAGPVQIDAPSTEVFDIDLVVNSVIAEKRAQYSHREQVAIRYDERGSSTPVRGNSVDFACAISNLINNAVEALESDGEIQVDVEAGASHVTLAVTDNGKGMSNDVITTVGTKGFSSGKTSKESGFGLGLYHAKQTAERSGGRLRIQSRLGEGTSVYLDLPRA
ncbi:MAG: HAMP domain-containing sensor histidine kinase [Bdellovibrionota bacterium]